MARRSTQVIPQAPALLTKSRSEARQQLIARQEAGYALIERSTHSSETLEVLQADYKKWSQYNVELISRMFTTDQYKTEYDWSTYSHVISMGRTSLSDERNNLTKSIAKKVEAISSLAERLDLINEIVGLSPDNAVITHKAPPIKLSRNVFLVHGHDEEVKSIVARFLEHCGLVPIILHEQADRGRTIIEKFEQSADVGFAVVLITPDDVGAAVRDGIPNVADMKSRARQNVILELGYFIGRLGRGHVCALKKGDPELPSDFGGVVYTPFGADESWKVRLMRELKAAGYEIDANAVFA
jgi:predicted nucleotide-binding protein